MKFNIIDVPIQKIKIDDTFFKITTKCDIDTLKLSIGSLGILSYPYLIKKNDKYRIVSGFKRITACNELKYKKITAKVISDKSSKFECSRLAIADNAFERELNIIEQSRCYHLLKKTMDCLCFSKKLGISLGIVLTKSVFLKIEPICSFDWSIQEGLIEKYLSLPVAIKIAKMNKENINIFIELFKKLNTTLNNQREIMEMIIEISILEKISIKNLFCSDLINEIINSTGCSQKINYLREYLKKRRYPIITSTFNKFNRELKRIKLHKHVKLVPPKFFEGKLYSLNILFDNPERLRNRKTDLDKIINSQIFFNLI